MEAGFVTNQVPKKLFVLPQKTQCSEGQPSFRRDLSFAVDKSYFRYASFCLTFVCPVLE